MEELVAGTPEYVFNEYLQIAIAWGLPALCLLLLIICMCFYTFNKMGQYGLFGSLLSLSVFALFSYPSQFPSFVSVMIIMMLVCIAQSYIIRRTLLRLIFVQLLFICSYVFYLEYQHNSITVDACIKWNNSRIFYQSGAYNQVIESYGEIENEMKNNPQFMFEYGHALHKLHKVEVSNKILSYALTVSGDPMILNIMGKNEQEMKRYDSAEQYFMRAVHRLPGRIYPYYLLAKLYTSPNNLDVEKFIWASDMVLYKKPKVHSKAINEMRDEVSKIKNNINELKGQYK